MTRETTQHYTKRDLRQQHSKAATHDNAAWYQYNMTKTWQHHNMAAAQHGNSTKHGTNIIRHRQQHKWQEGRDNNTSRKTATTVSKCP